MQLDRIRNLLLDIEQLSSDDQKCINQAGLINGIQVSITWDGHAFLDNIRSEERWNRVKKSAKSLDEAIQLADRYAREDVGLL